MKFIGFENKKTKVDYFIDSLRNPSFIFTGKVWYGDNEINNLVKIQKNCVFEVTFKSEENISVNKSGARITCIEKDTGKDFVLYNDAIGKVIMGLTSGEITLKDGWLTGTFVVHKRGDRYAADFVSKEDLKKVSKESDFRSK